MLTPLYRLVYDEADMPKMHLHHSEEDDEAQLEEFPMLLPPVMMDYGYNVRYVPARFWLAQHETSAIRELNARQAWGQRLRQPELDLDRHLSHHGGRTHLDWAQLQLFQRHSSPGSHDSGWHSRAGDG